MKHGIVRIQTLLLSALLLLSAGVAFAQEEAEAVEAAEGVAPGVTVLLVLGGLGMIALVGYVMSRREASESGNTATS